MIQVNKSFTAVACESQLWLDAHNAKRTQHNAAALEWDDAVADGAVAYQALSTYGHCCQSTTNQWQSDNGCTRTPCNSYYLTVEKGGPSGENLAWGYTDVGSVVNGWYDEVDHCSWPGCQGSATGHFTAMIWAGAKKLGCACGRASYGGVERDMYICRYKGDDVRNCNTPNMGNCYDDQVNDNSASPSPTPAPSPSPTPAPSPSPAPTPPVSCPDENSCVDSFTNCGQLSAQCGNANVKFTDGCTVDQHCSATCLPACGGGTTAAPSCTDSTSNCVQWTNFGLCTSSTYGGWMTTNCCVSCSSLLQLQPEVESRPIKEHRTKFADMVVSKVEADGRVILDQ